MNANVGDRIVVLGNKVGNPKREGVIVEVHGAKGDPPYVVRWSDGHQGLFFPGSDATIQPVGTSAQTSL